MYHLLTSMPMRRVLIEQIPAAVVSLGIAEVLYKFHSFLAESVAFLVTWFLIDAAYELARRVITGKNADASLDQPAGS